MEALFAVATVPPPVSAPFATVAITVPPTYGLGKATAEYLNMIPYVIPILVKPEAVNVTLLPKQAALAGVVAKVGIVGQMLQPPGPAKAKPAVAVQPLAAVTVTL